MSARPTDHDRVTVVELLRRCVENDPHRTFLDLNGETYSYADVWQRAQDMAGGLAALGVSAGQTIVSMQDTHIDAVASWFGANLLGAVWVGTNTALRGEFLRHVVTDAGSAVVICEQDHVERFTAISDRLPGVARVLHRGEPLGWRRDGLRIEPLADHLRALTAPVYAPTPDDLTCLTYTGGTTGPSKGCMISHGYAVNIARRGLVQTQRTSAEVNWSPLPMFHLNVLSMTIISTMLVRGTAALAPRFSVSGFWPEIERTGARVVNMIGAMPVMIAQQPDTPEMRRCYGQIRMVHCVPFSPALQEVWRERFGVTTPGSKGYGMTEVFPMTFQPAQDDSPAASAGRTNETDFEVRIVDESDNELPVGEVGEVVCRPRRPNVMFKGYWRRPEATLDATRNLWFHSGDLGRFDENGYFYFVDRKHDYLRRRGENISSKEVEAAYAAHPDIRQVAVHAVRSELSEDDLKVTAVRAAGSDLSAEELFEWSKERVPYFALPRYIEFRDELPLSPTGHVRKNLLRDQGCTPATWDRELADVTWERR
ncbi:AMP-binding protein [Actinomadura chibensis]|uniref:ATP-dependent acyl-CoA ligase n=1 Tax=Actinomadura chibensis TaxID=392828 RepID=A0A5D0NIP2_9ACTN|nr:AMP-binding protein [Actinomadura chibensis]TYB44297.1 ATP-dependent acyl-CoA ligase [Actinomadura chibensis]